MFIKSVALFQCIECILSESQQKTISMKRSSTPASPPTPLKLKRSLVCVGDSGIHCISSANTHQGNLKFKGAGRQCTAMSACAIIHSVVKKHCPFTTEDFDVVLKSGDDLYVALEPLINDPSKYLMADEIPTEIRVGDKLVKIENVANNYLTAGLYQENYSRTNEAVLQLQINLERHVFNDTWDYNSDGAIFTGSSASVAIWGAENGKFYLFNSHAVDTNNKSNANGVARLFETESLRSLAKMLLEYNPQYSSQYSLSKVRVCKNENPSIFANIIENDTTDQITQCSFEITNSYISKINPIPVEKITEKPAVIELSLTQCSKSSVSRAESPSILLNINYSAESVKSLNCFSDRSSVSQSILDQSNQHLTYAEIVKINLPVKKIKTTEIFKTAQNLNNTQTNFNKKPVVLIEKVNDFKLSVLKPVVVIAPIKSLAFNNTNSSAKRGRPMKTKRGRRSTKDNAHLDAVIKYNKNNPAVHRHSVQKYTVENPDVNRDAVKKYTQQNPDVHRDAVKKYTQQNPGVHRDAVKKYTQQNPDVHRDAVKKYTQQNPDVHRDAVKKYTQQNPDVHRDAVKKYTQQNPDVHRDAVKKYTQENPDVHRDAVKKYTQQNPIVNRDAVKKYTLQNPHVHRDAVQKYNENNPDVHRRAVQKHSQKNPELNKEKSSRYNKESRNVDIPLRQSSNKIGEKQGDELKSVKTMALKIPSLNSPNIHVCPFCNAKLFHEEKSRRMWCCGANKNNVQHLNPLTEDFYDNPAFLARSRAYNNMFAFSALGTTHGFNHPQDSISFIRIQGKVYHRVFDLAYNKTTNNIGLYINDPSEREQLASNHSLDLEVIRSISHFLHQVNPFIECFKKLNQEASDEAFIQFQKTSRSTHGNILGDLPVGREVSAVINTDRDQYVPRSIAVWKIGESKPHTVDVMHPLYESFQYPLLYPEGNAGWYPEKTNKDNAKLTQARYVRCLLLSEDRFSKLGRLSEEWMVDMYCRISEDRLRYIRKLQSNTNNEMRSAPLQELLNDETIVAEGVVPGRIYLPNSFTGGPRYMKMKYLDSIAIVNKFGPPSYFVTFTCNPKWPEIQQSTPAGHRPDPLICARVFNLRLSELIRDIRSGLWFGKVEYLTYVIEFQKRGLPHAHICFRVEGGGPTNNVDIDKVCRADIPSESEADGRLRVAVLNHMIHGPCGPDRDNLPCYDKIKQKCSKRFPKNETDVTYCDDRGFTHLRRNSQNKGTIKWRGREIEVSDLNVVPYNASLLLKYDAHINVEVSTNSSIVKYIFKYMTKGPDEARIAIVENLNDEIEDFVTKRYVGSSEAAWRILEFDVTSREPNVKQLSVHLENQQTVHFRTNSANDVTQSVQSGLRGGSDLITYFNRPQTVEFENLKYTVFYEKYIVHSKRPITKNQVFETIDGKHFITARQRGEMIARLYWVAPKQGEQFYLRMLLNSFPCRSYADLLSLGGPNCKTFQEAAMSVGIADNAIEYERCMQEASAFFTGPRLRRFFVLLAVNGVAVATLWDTFKNQLSEDILHRMPNETENAYNECLIQIKRLLRKHGSSLILQGLPEVHDATTELSRERVEYDANQQIAIVDEWLPLLSSEQKNVFNYVDSLCRDENFRNNNPSAIFVDGPAGTGKTTLLKAITANVRGNLNGIVLCVASSAVAALNMEGGVTAHSMFKFPLDVVDDDGYWNITNKTQRAELIYNANVIIYDETPMAHKYLIHMLDRSLRDLMQSRDIFGGKIIIFAGDFRQLPPVVINARSNSDIVNSSVKKSPLWPQLKTFSLATSQRCRDDPEYAEFLLHLGSNLLPWLPIRTGNNIQKVVSLDLIERASNLEELIDFVFSVNIVEEPDICAMRAILCTRNDAVREINSIVLNRLPGETLHFYSHDKLENDEADQLYLGPDVLKLYQPQGFPEFDLKLKIGCVCMVTRNLSFADGLVNGVKVIVTDTSPRLITVRKKGCYDNLPYLIPRILFKGPMHRNSPYEMSRRQFPLQVCYAMTIHKSQGQTIERVGVDLRSDVFSHGQLYVALGRVQEKSAIKILIHKDREINGIPYANNVIIPELIS